jgi:hypothetical protein
MTSEIDLRRVYLEIKKRSILGMRSYSQINKLIGLLDTPHNIHDTWLVNPKEGTEIPVNLYLK